ncbi:hypothetical protein [Halobiforma nitratireducens]|uniref:Uncharacterized protein n=1 Tax=Halobiforma nitratireducens JCM 10879 TaxID=1227454 RepID=M0L312_9EURY|nr:hypothetical protein [Halobiforma nitratireducens]EMA27478.1 hypothetical protein C446_17866 [Halobiforma nitratireducens JCM 10879]
MIDWVGGQRHFVNLLVPTLGICVLFVVSKRADTNGSERYFMASFVLWLAFSLLVGLEAGALLSFPDPFGWMGAVLSMIGFVIFYFCGVFAVVNERDPFGHLR